MNNFFKRLITAIFFTGSLLGSLLLSEYSFFILVEVLTILTLREFYTIVTSDTIRPQWTTGFMVAISLVSTTGMVLLDKLPLPVMILNLPLFFLVFIYELYTKSDKPFTNIAFTVLGIFYIALPFTLLLVIPHLSKSEFQYNPHLVFGYLLLLWASDTGAYLSGMAFGKHRLFERISPKKSWEGSIGGALLCLFIAWCCSKWFVELSFQNWAVTGLLIVVTGTFGDLAESLLKRSLKIKDSGKLLPGHGGALDRFDAMLVSIPFVVAYLVLIKNI